MGYTDDSAGFNGGTSLSLISADFAKMIKRLQSTMQQAITDIINLLLIDKKQSQYINKFSIHMLEPMTEEDKNRQENLSSEIQLTSDVMNLVSDIDNQSIKFKILKAMLSNTITNTEVIDLIQQEIDSLDEEQEESEEDENLNFDADEMESNENESESGSSLNDFAMEQPVENENQPEETMTELPNMNDLGMNFADSTQF